MLRVNIGCGNAPAHGWLNMDNSPVIKLANSRILYKISKFLRLLSLDQIDNIGWHRKNSISFQI